MTVRNVFASAIRAFDRYFEFPAAVMAYPGVLTFVICKSNAAVRTFYDMSAVAARNECRISSPVQEQNSLPACTQTLIETFGEKIAEHPAVSPSQLLFHIRRLYDRKS